MVEIQNTAPAVAKPSEDSTARARRSKITSLPRGALAVGSLVLAFLIWQFLSTILFNPFLIPPPLEVIRTAIPMLKSGEILDDVAISMTRVLVGFVTGSLAGIITGVLLGRFRVLHDLLDPILELLRYLSPTAPANGFVASERNAKFTKFGSELHAASLITACINTAAPASRSSGRVSSRTLWLRPPTLGTNIIPDGQIRAIICAS